MIETKDIVVIGLLVFNAGGWAYTALNHMRHVNKCLREIFKRLGVIEQRVSHIEGKLNSD